LHFDPFYDGSLFGQLQTRPAEDWGAILEKSQPAGFNPRGTDSNYALVKSSLDAARARIARPDFILYPGDLMAHQCQGKYDGLAKLSHLEDPAAYQAFTGKAIRFLAGEFNSRFPGIAILPTLGNDDSYCGDYMIDPEGPFLRMFAEAWAPLIGPDRDREAFRKTFSRGGYFTISHGRLPHDPAEWGTRALAQDRAGDQSDLRQQSRLPGLSVRPRTRRALELPDLLPDEPSQQTAGRHDGNALDVACASHRWYSSVGVRV